MNQTMIRCPWCHKSVPYVPDRLSNHLDLDGMPCGWSGTSS